MRLWEGAPGAQEPRRTTEAPAATPDTIQCSTQPACSQERVEQNWREEMCSTCQAHRVYLVQLARAVDPNYRDPCRQTPEEIGLCMAHEAVAAYVGEAEVLHG